ncbi:MAG TPA: OmpA family protein [Stellaceae bacterium]|jgi:outer membrane protein OmpA-like peptidoglycan-associated protein
MTKRFLALLGGCVAVTALSCAVPAQAQWYIGGEAGWSDLTDAHDHGGGGPTIKKSFDDGYSVGARAGYQMGPWRFEEEYVYHNNGLDRLSVAGFHVPGASGSRSSHAIMSNVIYDVNMGWPVTPHIGAGIGAVDVVENAKLPGIGALANDDSWQFGYQGIVGATYNINPNLSLDVDYRYLATTDPSFHYSPNVGGGTYHSSYATHNFLASLVYHFAPPAEPIPVAAPAAVPAPPPPPQRQVFLVFFDWDRDTITPQGAQIIQQAANAYRSGAHVQLQVTGYTDRSGSQAYNQRLSERRANNTANTLVRDGVPRNQMAVSGRGENDNRVPTAAGVREPQNRRVEIVFP